MSGVTIRQGVLPHVYVLAENVIEQNAAGESGTVNLKDLAMSMTGGSASRRVPRRTDSSPSPLDREPAANPLIDPSRVILTFRGYFNESVPESPTENWRVRRLIVRYFVDDSTVEIHDPDIRNDGIIHGKFLKRSVLPGLTRDNFLEKLRVNGVIDVHGRGVRLYACDDLTKRFFEDVGYPQEPDVEAPEDAFTSTHRELFGIPASANFAKTLSPITRYLESQKGNARTSSFKMDFRERYLKYDGVVLRFLLVWVDPSGPAPERTRFWLSYYLVTEEVEISEERGQRDYECHPQLLKRRKLPRYVLAHDDRMRGVEDETGREDYYTEDDLRVGDSISVFGRDMLIVDCDDSTQAWYIKEKGLDQRAARIEYAEPEPVRMTIPIPAHNGIGSEEDSLAQFKSLVLKPPRKAPRKETGVVLRFRARLISSDPIDKSRIFVVSYYADDKEVSIYEPPIRNSGIQGGQFLKRTKPRNPDNSFFEAAQFHVGAMITVHRHSFELYAEEKGNRHDFD